jgi:aquaporin Z
LAAAVFSAAWGPWADSVDTARTVPEPHLGLLGAAGIEAALTFGLLMTVFVMVSSPRTARWTPAVVTGVLPVLIWAGAPHTGASMNPARTLGPDAVASAFTAIWCYLAGPVAGAAVAAGALTVVTRRRTLTAKLFHDPEYPSVHATSLPAKPHPRSRRRQAGAHPYPAPAESLKDEGARRP